MKNILLCITCLIVASLPSFSQVEFNIYAELGQSFVRSKYQDRNLIDNMEYENTIIRSRPVTSLSTCLLLTVSINPILDLDLALGLTTRGYKYKIFDYLDQGNIKTSYRQYEVLNSIGFKAFLFESMKGQLTQKKKKSRITSQEAASMLPFLLIEGYQSYSIGSRYRYNGIDESSLFEYNPFKYTYGYGVGLGMKYEQSSFAVVFKSDVSDFVEVDINEYNPRLRNWTFRIYKNLNFKK